MAKWADLEGLRWADLNRLTWAQIETWTSEVWDLLRDLEPAARTALLDGIKDGSLPPALLAAGESQYDRVEAAALSLFTRYAPKDASQMAAYLAVLVSLLTVLANRGSDPPPPTPPPPQVVVLELPPECRPTGGPAPAECRAYATVRAAHDAAALTSRVPPHTEFFRDHFHGVSDQDVRSVAL